jgi:5'-methylthioadenosine phosphorylase
MLKQDSIGIIGGSGLYDLALKSESLYIDTPYGKTSSPIKTGELGEKKIYFISRHGLNHEIPPHCVNYKANIHALYQLGVRHIIATHALGSLNPNMKPGDFVLSDQFINRTWGREDTFYNGPETVHISTSDPFCSYLRNLTSGYLEESKYQFHNCATMLVIQGPRFSTRAENRIFYNEGNDVISMTGYPEAVLAREQGICYVSLGIVTDIACVLGSEEHPEQPSSHTDVVLMFQHTIGNLKKVLYKVIENINSNKGDCNCVLSLKGAKKLNG